MKRGFALVITAVILALAACGRRPTVGSPTATLASPAATVIEVVNTVDVRASTAEAVVHITPAYGLGVGGQVQTGAESKARLDFLNGTIVRLAPNSFFEITGPAASQAGGLARLRLEVGKIWAIVSGGSLEVETPVGVAAVRGSFAVIEYVPGDPDDPNDDIFIVGCLEGVCTIQNSTFSLSLGNLQEATLTDGGQTVIRFALTEDDVEEFIDNNPEARQSLPAALAAAASPTPTKTPTSTATPTSTSTSTQTPTTRPTSTATATPTATRVPPPAASPVTILGRHVVRPGETLLCIARGYGVLPTAIAQVNRLVSPFTLFPNQVLAIPAVRWFNISAGPVCPTQFNSPFPGLALPTVTSTLAPSPTSTARATASATLETPPAPPPTDTPTSAPSPTASQTSVPTQTPTHTATPTASATPTPDTVPPAVRNFKANPTSVDQTSTCTVTFDADLSDPSAVASASVEWRSFDRSGMPTGSAGTQPMGLISGTVISGTWRVTFSLITIPSFGSLDWDVKGTDTAANTSVVPSNIPISAGQNGCP